MTREPIDIEDGAAVRDALLALLGAVEAEDAGRSEDGRPVVLDQTSLGRLSRMDALQGQAMALAGSRRREARKARILSALRRLEDGTFGSCVTCGEEIAPRRLSADPSVPTCLACAADR